MATQVQYGIPVVFGVNPARPIANLPPDARRVKIRCRAGNVARAFIQREGSTEQWTLGYENDNPAANWALRFKDGVNYR